MVTILRIIIAGTHSGCDKTTIAIGLMAALTGRGLWTGHLAVRGHEFHYSELVSTALAPAYRMTGYGGESVEGWCAGKVLGSYVHAHFGSNPALAANLVAACAR